MENVNLPPLPVPANANAPWTTDEAMALAISFARRAVLQERARCRSAFEEWWRANYANELYRSVDGTYTRDAINRAWEAYTLSAGADGGFCIRGPHCRCKGLEVEQRQGCEEWANAD